jgi:hypothetical protein
LHKRQKRRDQQAAPLVVNASDRVAPYGAGGVAGGVGSAGGAGSAGGVGAGSAGGAAGAGSDAGAGADVSVAAGGVTAASCVAKCQIPAAIAPSMMMKMTTLTAVFTVALPQLR